MHNERPGRLRVGIIGAGRVGAVLGAALTRAGHRVTAASAVSAASRGRVERLLPGTAILPPPEVIAQADLVLLTVPDDTLPGLAGSLEFPAGQLVVHTAGAYGINVLEPALRRHALPMALHPAMTFTNRAEDLDRLDGISWGITAPDELKLIAEALVVELGGEPEFIAEAARPLYHAALVHGANHLVTLVNEAVDLLRSSGVVNAERMIAPLLSAALDNTLRLGDAALSGPVVRGDAGTVAAHLGVLSETMPESVAAYLALARRTADRAISGGRLKAVDAEDLLGVLAVES
ncbi:Rossmann-like and DUF2520 domain-containing protein [Longispora albida]|uniref:Rossmann-like and DUF2520 domain-containing protein n=1 Tax=Longispora albida TaxID=203523 RepID=UPI000361F8A2|nr:DUF2520 domain-containing protein [Longispora albida]